MNLSLPTEGLDRYTSPSQRARICTEPWGLANLYCPACDSPRIESLPTNTPAHDFKCPKCREWFQLKSQKRKLGNSLADGAFGKMVEAIHQDKTPNLFALHYDANTWSVQNLILIPRFTYTLSAIKCRTALRPTAERHGWIGCSINLGLIPPEAKIPVIVDGDVKPSSEIRTKFRKLHKLEQKSVEARGWTLDVLNAVHSLGKREFSLQEVYDFESALGRLHPSNRNIQPKIRQQLQELRKLGLLEFLKPGQYRML